MSLRSLLFLAVAAPAAARYEWYGVVKLSHEAQYDLTIKTLDATMDLYIAEINEGAALAVAALASAQASTEDITAGTNYGQGDWCSSWAAWLSTRANWRRWPRAKAKHWSRRVPCT